MDQAIHQRDVGANADLKVQVGTLPDRGAFAWVDDHNATVVLAFGSEHAFPQHGLRFRHVVAIQAQQLCLIDVNVARRRSVGAEVGHQPGRGGGGAQARVAVDIGGLQSAAPQLTSV